MENTTKKKGIVASAGMAIGKVFKFERLSLEVPTVLVSDDCLESEIVIFINSVEGYKSFLQQKIDEESKQSDIFSAHIGMLEDPFLIETVEAKIRDENKNAAMAVNETGDEIIAMMESLDDPYLKERAADYRDIKSQLLHRILGVKVNDFSDMTEEGIIVAKDLTPSDTSMIDVKLVKGFVTNLGGKTAHTSIIAQTLGIPALVGMGDVFESLEDDQIVIIDTEAEELIINPTEKQIEEFNRGYDIWQKELKRVEENKFDEAITTDGKRIDVFCNIGNLEDLEMGLSKGAEGVGLFRTEFLYMKNTHFPTEDEQFEVYKAAAERLEGRPLTIRTLDIGGDKELPYFTFPEEDNPFLGWRALRICFDMPEVFNFQLRAILRASAYGKIHILLPMVISVSEIKKTIEIIENLKVQLTEEGIPFDREIEVGIMVETPASVMIADELIKYVDYFSIGTNDLTQYLLAVDRGNQKIANLYNSYHPAVLRSILKVIEASHNSGKWTGMCGGFASDPKATKLLLGLGLDEFSVVGANAPKIKDTIRGASLARCEVMAKKLIQLETSEEIENAISKWEHTEF